MTTTVGPPRTDDPEPRSSRQQSLVGPTLLVVFGTLLTVTGLVLGGLAATAIWATARQSGGQFITAPTARYVAGSYALTSTPARITADPSTPAGTLADTRIQIKATAADQQPIFVGVAERADVDRYLAGVARTELVAVRFNPFRPLYRTTAGDRTPADPSSQPFWVASAAGPATQQIAVGIQPGDWVVVVMNADPRPGVSADVTAGFRSQALPSIATGLGIATIILLGGGVVLLVAGAAGLGRRTATAASRPLPPSPSTEPVPAPYPARLVGELQPGPSRWLWLVKWVLIFPHAVILAGLWIAFVVTTIVAGVAILFTRRYPLSLFTFNVGVLRWTWRVGFYAYSALGTDQYPPFTLARTDYPADFDVTYPEQLSRGLVLVKSWLLAIPHLIIVTLITSPWSWVSSTAAANGEFQRVSGFSLLGLLVFISALAVTFTGRYPTSLFDLIVGINRWVYRVTTYVALMTDEYPPFRLDQGPAEPSADPPTATPPAAAAPTTAPPTSTHPLATTTEADPA